MTQYPRELLIADTGPLIVLERIPDGFAYFRKFVRKLVVPTEVMAEYLIKPRVPPEAYEGFIEVRDIPPEDRIQRPNNIFSDAEMAALSMAYKSRLTLLIEEKEILPFAQRQQVAVTNVANEYVKACVAGYIGYKEAKARLYELRDIQHIKDAELRLFLRDLKKRAKK